MKKYNGNADAFISDIFNWLDIIGEEMDKYNPEDEHTQEETERFIRIGWASDVLFTMLHNNNMEHDFMYFLYQKEETK